MTPLEVLTAARALIAEPEHWCQDSFARDAQGNRKDPENKAATQFCLEGSVHRVCHKCAVQYEVYGILHKQIDAGPLNSMGKDITIWNDTHTHAEVIGLLDQAIAELSTC